MGDVMEMLEENNVDVVMNISEAAQLERWLPALQGTRAGAQLLAKRIRLEGIEINAEDIMPEPEQPTGEPLPEQAMAQGAFGQMKQLTQ